MRDLLSFVDQCPHALAPRLLLLARTLRGGILLVRSVGHGEIAADMAVERRPYRRLEQPQPCRRDNGLRAAPRGRPRHDRPGQIADLCAPPTIAPAIRPQRKHQRVGEIVEPAGFGVERLRPRPTRNVSNSWRNSVALDGM